MRYEDKYEKNLQYTQDNYTSRINANNPLALEKALLQHLEEIQRILKSPWSATDTRTVREVYKSGLIPDEGGD